jgi:hypothetical protein
LCDLRVAANQPDAVTLTYLRARSGDRRFEETKLFSDARSDLGQLIRIAGTCADDDFTGGRG